MSETGAGASTAHSSPGLSPEMPTAGVECWFWYLRWKNPVVEGAGPAIPQVGNRIHIVQHSSLMTCELEREVSLPLHLLLVPLVSAEEKYEEGKQQPSSNLSCLLIPRGACLCRYTTGQPGRRCASFLGSCCSQHSKISSLLTAGAFIRGVYVLLMDLSRAYPGR